MGGVAVGVVVLARALVANDFSLVYVADFSRRGASTLYRVASLWGGMAGSLLWFATLVGAAGLLVASLTAGFCLALGTWSTVAGQTADAVLAGRWGAAGRIWAAHLGLGLFAAVAGWGLGLGARLLVA